MPPSKLLPLLIFFLPFLHHVHSDEDYGEPSTFVGLDNFEGGYPKPSTFHDGSLTIKRSRKFALLFSCLQCISETDPETAEIREINRKFNPEKHMHRYRHKRSVKRLIRYTREIVESPERYNEPYTNAADSVSQLLLIFHPLYENTHDWDLFYKTSAWLIGRVNNIRLYLALCIVAREKFPTTLVTPTAAEVWPQLYFNKSEVAKVIGITVKSHPNELLRPLPYWTGDPNMHEFHEQWHSDQPFWWNDTKYNSPRDRKGELFFYTHHQVVSRYNAERVSNGLDFVTPLELDPDYVFPEPFYPDVINVNNRNFPIRKEGERMRDWNDGTVLEDLTKWYNRFDEAIEQGYMIRTDFTHESLRFDNATDIVARTIEPSQYTLNIDFYGSLHNFFHRYLSGLFLPRGPSPAAQANPDTSMRDPAFYRLHGLVDSLYLKLKSFAVPYTDEDLNFPGVKINSVKLLQGDMTAPTTTLQTFMDTDTYDISVAANPCRGVGEEPTYVTVPILNHDPFNYSISITNKRSTTISGLVRIFLLPQVDYEGMALVLNDTQVMAIQLDLFPVTLSPNSTHTIRKSSIYSYISKTRSFGIKPLYNMKSPQALTNDVMRSCGWPHNLLLPRGNEEGLPFTLFVMISEEPGQEERDITANFGYCGMINGMDYPDRRAFGFPFDRQETDFTPYRNVQQVPITIQHVAARA